MLINYNNVTVCQEAQVVLQDVNFKVDEGEFVYITGKVGSGKSSLLKTIYGELPIKEGNAMVMDYKMEGLKRKHLPDLRKKLGIIFQDFKLLNDRSVDANLRFVLKATGWKKNSLINQRVEEVLKLVGMETKGYKFPNELSGGEQQRIAIARAILNNPKLILADEPTGNLDVETSKNIAELLHGLVKEQGTSVIMITHNLSLLDLYPGRVLQCTNHHLVESMPEGKERDIIDAEEKVKESLAEDKAKEAEEKAKEAEAKEKEAKEKNEKKNTNDKHKK